ncbi:transporter [Salix suchowensis]|nr:transporter [Salix suchowensis]
MAQRRSQHRGSHTTALDSRRYPYRRSPPQKRASAHPAPSYDTAFYEVRPVLVPLHPNLRRLPSRLLNSEKEDMTRCERGPSDVLAGSKRKRVVSRNENVNSSSRGSLKRLRSVSSNFHEDSSEEEEHSAMEVDRWSESHDTETEDEEYEGNVDSSDEHLINEAPANQLLRMRKDELARLYSSAGLLDDAEALTKHEIVDAIVAARDDVAELPPSSPPRGDGDSSDGSSDDGNVAGDEETDSAPRRTSTLRRRVTINDVARTSSKSLQKRSLSMGHFTGGDISVFPLRKANRALGADKRGSLRSDNSRRRTVSQCSSDLRAVVIDRSPPATRTRSRKVSAPTHPITPVSSTSSRSSTRNSKGKGKAKQVEFCDEMSRELRTPAKTKKRERSADSESSRREELDFGESDLTDLDDQCDEVRAVEPSPRRLRSKDRLPSYGAESAPVKSSRARSKAYSQGSNPGRRITPMRKAKGKAQCHREDVDEDSDEEEEEAVEVDDDQMDDDAEEAGVESDEEAEVDQLVSSASVTPPPPTGRRTPVKRRLRPRRVQTFTPPSDGDDEGSGGTARLGTMEKMKSLVMKRAVLRKSLRRT